MRRWIVVALLTAVAVAGGSLYATGKLAIPEAAAQWFAKKEAEARPVPLPAVTVVKAAPEQFVEKILVTGSLVAREEIVVAPEVSGQRVVELLVDIGDDVRRGQVLAKLVTSNLDAQLAQNAATRARAEAARAQAKSEVIRAEAQKEEADSALARAVKLKRTGNLAESIYEQRVAAARSAAAQLAAAKDGVAGRPCRDCPGRCAAPGTHVAARTRRGQRACCRNCVTSQWPGRRHGVGRTDVSHHS